MVTKWTKQKGNFKWRIKQLMLVRTLGIILKAGKRRKTLQRICQEGKSLKRSHHSRVHFIINFYELREAKNEGKNYSEHENIQEVKLIKSRDMGEGGVVQPRGLGH